MAASFVRCAQSVRLAWVTSAKLCEQHVHGSEIREVHLSALGVAEQLLNEALDHAEATLWACTQACPTQRPAQPAAMPAASSGTSDWRPPRKPLNLQSPSELEASDPVRGEFAMPRFDKVTKQARGKSDADRKFRASEHADQLPSDTLTPEEEELKAALLDFLDNWHEDEPPHLQLACAPPSRIINLLLQIPNQASLPKWIAARLSKDIEIREYQKGRQRMTYFHRCGQLHDVPETAAVPKRAVVAKRSQPAASTQSKNVKRPRMDTTSRTTASYSAIKPERTEEAPLDDHATLTKLDFFKGLPQDEFTPEEEALRDALLLFLDDWTNSLPATVGDAGGRAGKAAGVGPAKRALLGQGVTLQAWCENRMAAELDLMETSLGTFIDRVGQLDRELVRNHVQSAS